MYDIYHIYRNMHTRSYISSGRNVEMPHAPRFRRGCVRPGSDNNSAGAAENGRRRALVKKERMHNRNKEKERNKNKREEIDIYARFSDRAVCTRQEKRTAVMLQGNLFPLSHDSTHTLPPSSSRRTIWQQWLAITDIVAVDWMEGN